MQLVPEASQAVELGAGDAKGQLGTPLWPMRHAQAQQPVERAASDAEIGVAHDYRHREDTMSNLVPAEDIERIVGVARHRKAHYGRASSTEQVVYILHSKECLASGIDLTYCRFSVALDRGIDERRWLGYEDVPVALGVWNDDLVPLKGTEVRVT
jgi:hypothetical protein